MPAERVSSLYLEGWNFAARLVGEIDALYEGGARRLWLAVLDETRLTYDSKDQYGNGMLAALWCASEDEPEGVPLPSWEEKHAPLIPGEAPLVLTLRMTTVPGVAELVDAR